MESRARPKFNAQVYQEACEWFVEFRTGAPDEAARRVFHAWLHESPAHMGAYLEATALWNEGAALDRERRWTPEALIALAAEDLDNVVAHPAVFPSPTPAAPQASGTSAAPVRDHASVEPVAPVDVGKKSRVKYALAASLLIACCALGLISWPDHAVSYATGVGEQRFIAFPDGSSVNLNSRSRIRVRYSVHERAVDLLEGQALFSVAKDTARPFIVRSDAARVRAVGTQFDVYRKASGTVVTVVEGRVAIEEPPRRGDLQEGSTAQSAGESAIFLSAGEQIRVAADVEPQPVAADVARATAWTQRQLVFESTPLAEVAEEFNRYNQRQLLIRDPELDDFQIDGVFSSTDPSSLLRFLRERREVQVTETHAGIVITRR